MQSKLNVTLIIIKIDLKLNISLNSDWRLKQLQEKRHSKKLQ